VFEGLPKAANKRTSLETDALSKPDEKGILLPAQVVRSISVAARAVQWALARNFNGKHGCVAHKNLTPELQNIRNPQSTIPRNIRVRAAYRTACGI
jgi:hypothetical protein